MRRLSPTATATPPSFLLTGAVVLAAGRLVAHPSIGQFRRQGRRRGRRLLLPEVGGQRRGGGGRRDGRPPRARRRRQVGRARLVSHPALVE